MTNNKQKLIGLLLLLLLIAYSIFILTDLNAANFLASDSPEAGFSTQHAIENLKIISASPRNAGADSHDKIRDYIVNYCKTQGLVTKIQTGVGFKQDKSHLVAGAVSNIIAVLPGTNPKNAILVISHYDTQPNTFGAADNGAGVCAMMETIRVLKKSERLSNDVIFLFTDQEEIGQLGADVFSKYKEYMDRVRLVLNFDARGNAGRYFTFEASGKTTWLMKGLAEAVNDPMANSLSYQIYKHLPNFTDFTVFKRKGIEGLNSASIGGYAYYHSFADNMTNIDKNSVTHLGGLMLGLTRHFGMIDLSGPHQTNAIFFNLTSHWLLVFNSVWDWVLIIATLFAFICFVFIAVKYKVFLIRGLIRGAFVYVISIFFVLGLTWVVKELVLLFYPYYKNFYNASFYNANYYLLVFVGVGLLVFTCFYRKRTKQIPPEALWSGSILIQITGMLLVGIMLPGTAYLFYVPLIIMLPFYSYQVFKQRTKKDYSFSVLLDVLVLIVPLTLWLPYVFIFYEVFGFSSPFLSMALICLFFPVLLPIADKISISAKHFLSAVSMLLIVIGMGMAHCYSKPTATYPVRNQLVYSLDVDRNIARWFSPQEEKNKWISNYVNTKRKKSSMSFLTTLSTVKAWEGKAQVMEYNSSVIHLISDSLQSGRRKFRLLFVPAGNVRSFDLVIPDSLRISAVNNVSLPYTSSCRILTFNAPSKDGVLINLEGPFTSNILRFQCLERILGLPQSLINVKPPVNSIYAPGYMSNVTLIQRQIDVICKNDDGDSLPHID